jgi:hypothetical protein
MSDREFAFGQLLATLGPQSEVEIETLQSVFNAGWDARDSEREITNGFGRLPMLPVVREHINRVFAEAAAAQRGEAGR